MDKIFTAEERTRFTEDMRPLVESRKGIARFSSVFHMGFQGADFREAMVGSDIMIRGSRAMLGRATR
jgi:hypothetical protein